MMTVILMMVILMMVILMMVILVILVIVILLIVTVRRMRVDVGHLANRDPLIELTPSASR